MSGGALDGRRVVPLAAVRADGWLRTVGEGARNFEQLCDVVGERFVAFAIIAGVRIAALTLDKRSPDATLIDFLVGEDPREQRLPLGEFRRRLAAALLSNEEPAVPLAMDAGPEEIQRYLGIRYVLLAPLFGLRLHELAYGGDAPEQIVVEIGGMREGLTLDAFRELLRERIRAEVARARPDAPFAIDLAIVADAEAALGAGDADRVIQLLGAWPGPLALLLRTAEGQSLVPETRAALAHALGLLGSAYVRRAKFEWAEEVLRLGIQWATDGPRGGDVYRRLGEACVVRERYGEAIGILRRASQLGADAKDVLPLLARCFLRRGRYVAAMVCLEDAVTAGASPAELEPLFAEARASIGEAFAVFRGRFPLAIEPRTIPSPSRKPA